MIGSSCYQHHQQLRLRLELGQSLSGSGLSISAEAIGNATRTFLRGGEVGQAWDLSAAQNWESNRTLLCSWSFVGVVMMLEATEVSSTTGEIMQAWCSFFNIISTTNVAGNTADIMQSVRSFSDVASTAYVGSTTGEIK